MKGSRYLQATGLLMLVFSVINTLGLIALMLFMSWLSDFYARIGMDSLLVYSSFVVSLIVVVVRFIAGVMGAKYYNTPEKSQACFIMGIILIATCVVTLIYNIITTQISLNVLDNLKGSFTISQISYQISNIVNFLVNLVLPVLFLIGAVKNKSSGYYNND